MKPRVFLLVVFASGWCALSYQVAWERLFVVNFGVDFYSVSAITAAFLTGLGLGAWLLGLYSDRVRSPLRLYGYLELGIGAFGLVSVPAIQSLYPVALGLQRELDSLFLYFLANFGLVFALIIAPTMLMGGTLPTMVRHLYRSSKDSGTTIGRLYAVNTLGSVLGAGGTALATISLLRVDGAIYLASAVNLALGFFCVNAARTRHEIGTVRTEAEASIEPVTMADPGGAVRQLKWLLLLYFLSSVVAIAYEIVWFRLVAFQWQNATGGFALLLTFYLAGVALGSGVFARLSHRVQNGMAAFATLQFATVFVSLAGLAAYLTIVNSTSVSAEELLLGVYQIIHPGAELGSRAPESGLVGVVWQSAVVMIAFAGLVTLPMVVQGMAFPLVAKVAVDARRKPGGTVGEVYLISILGSFGGAFLGGYVFLPVVGIQGTLQILVALSLAAGLVAFVLGRKGSQAFPRRRWQRTAAAGAAVCVTAFVAYPGDIIARFYPWEGRVSTVVEGITGIVMVKERGDYAAVIINGQNHGALSPYRFSRDDAKMAVAVNLHPDPKRVLLIGLGNARTLAAIEPYREVETIDVVEISRELLPALRAQGDLSWLQRVLNSDKVRYHLEDGRMFLNRTSRPYDIIAMAPVFSHNAYGGYLFSKEMFEAIRDHLEEDGIFISLNDALTPDMRFTLIETFRSVFPHFYLDNGNYLYGMKRQLVPDPDRIAESWDLNREWLEAPGFNLSKGRNLLNAPGAIFAHLRSDQAAFEDVKGFPLNTDLAPVTEFWLFRYSDRASQLAPPLARRSVAYNFSSVSVDDLTLVVRVDFGGMRFDSFGRGGVASVDISSEGISLSMAGRGNAKVHNGTTRLGSPPGANERVYALPSSEEESYLSISGDGEGIVEVQVQHWNAEKEKWQRLLVRSVSLSGSDPEILPFTARGDGHYRFVVGAYDRGSWRVHELTVMRQSQL